MKCMMVPGISTSCLPTGNILKYDEVEEEEKDNTMHEIEILEAPDKPLIDEKEYRVIKLPNGLTALLISDLSSSKDWNSRKLGSACDEEKSGKNDINIDQTKEAGNSEENTEDTENVLKISEAIVNESEQKQDEQYLSGAALCIGVGCFEDPVEIPGLMHFLEHMVLSGSKKYSNEDCFTNLIRELKGCHVARTRYEKTTFHFDVQEMHFERCLDRFASCFISPLMKEESLQKEIKNIQSEFETVRHFRLCQLKQLLASVANPDHPVSFFKIGNEKTLQHKFSDQEYNAKLIEIWTKYYSAQHMTVSIKARETLDKLQELIASKFSEIANHGSAKPSYENFECPFSQKSFHRLFKIIPMYSYTELRLSWVMPPLSKKYYESKPIAYISHFLEYGGLGSIFSYLKKRSWTMHSQTTETLLNNSSCELFALSLLWNSEGIPHVKDIIKLIFQYIRLMKEEGPNPKRFSELQQLRQNDFDFNSSDNLLCTDLKSSSEALGLYPSKRVLTGRSLLYKFDPEVIEECLSKIEVKNVNIMILSEHFETENLSMQEEEWFGTKYCVEDIPQDWIEEWENAPPNPELYLPIPNEFISDDFEIYKWSDSSHNPPEFPQNAESNEKGKLWFKQDFKFCLPKAYCNVYFQFQDIGKSPEIGVMVDLFLFCFNERWMEIMYLADLAQYKFYTSLCDLGFVLHVWGFNQKLYNCLEMILNQMTSFDQFIDDDFFEKMKLKQLVDYHSSFYYARCLAKDVSDLILKKIYLSFVEKMKILKKMQRGNFISIFFKEIFPNKFVDVLVQGNITEKEAKRLFHLIIKTSSGSGGEIKCPKMQVRKCKSGEYFVRLKSISTTFAHSCFVNYYQGEFASLKTEIINEFIVMVMQDAATYYLVDQFHAGYHVECSHTNTFGVLSISVKVETGIDVGLSYINEKVDSFMETFLSDLKSMEPLEFIYQKKMLKNRKLMTCRTLQEEVEQNTEKITNDDYMFDRQQQQIPLISTLALEDICAYLQNIVSPLENNNYRKLSVQVLGPIPPKDGIERQGYQNILDKPIKEVMGLLSPKEVDLENGLTKDNFVSQLGPFIEELTFFDNSNKN